MLESNVVNAKELFLLGSQDMNGYSTSFSQNVSSLPVAIPRQSKDSLYYVLNIQRYKKIL